MSDRTAEADAGSTLIMSIAFILAMGLGVAGLLTYLFAGQVAGTTVTEHGRELYALDTAAETAIARLRFDKTLGVGGLPNNCGLPTSESVNGYTVTVTCTADPLSRQPTTVPGGGGAGGRRGIVALGSGVTFKNLSSIPLEIAGGIASRGDVRAENGDVAIEGEVAGTCVEANGGRLLAEPDLDPLGSCDPPSATDPGWSVAGATAPPITTPSCPGGLIPSGAYESAVVWQAAIDACGGVAGFAGIYHLNLMGASGSCASATWCMTTGKKYLAGYNEVTEQCASGATFVLMGDTKMFIDGADAKMCGTSLSGDSVSVYAKESGGGGVVSTEVALLPTTATRSTAGAMKFANETNALTYGTVGVARLDYKQGGQAGTQTASLAVSGFPTVPGSTVTKALLDIQHGEGATAGSTATITVLVNGSPVGTITKGDACSSSFCWREVAASAPENALTNDSLDISHLLDTPASLSSAVVTLRVDADLAARGDVWSYIGGIQLRATYDAPTVTGTSCLAPCTILETQNANSDVTFFGAVYVPDSNVRLHAVNAAVSTIAGGIVVSSLDVQTPASLASADNFHIGLTSTTTTVPGPPTQGAVDLLLQLNAHELSAHVVLPNGTTPTPVRVSEWAVR